MYLLGVRKESLNEECRHIRLQELVAALELLVFRLDDLNTVNNLHEACLELLGLSKVNKLVIVSKTVYGQSCSTTGGVQDEHCKCKCRCLVLLLPLHAIAARGVGVWW